MLEVCYADGGRKGWKQNAVFFAEFPNSLLWRQPAKLCLIACTPCSMFTTVLFSEGFQIWVHSASLMQFPYLPPAPEHH